MDRRDFMKTMGAGAIVPLLSFPWYHRRSKAFKEVKPDKDRKLYPGHLIMDPDGVIYTITHIEHNGDYVYAEKIGKAYAEGDPIPTEFVRSPQKQWIEKCCFSLTRINKDFKILPV